MAMYITVQAGEASTPMKDLLSENLKQADNLRMGQLANGFSYVMLPNKVPPQRFEAHLEMHAGMVQASALQMTCLNQPSHHAEAVVLVMCKHLRPHA